jgi:hypothetical protein
MEHQGHFDTSEAEQREAVNIRKMIRDLDRSIQLLNCDIASEEERTRISDRSDAAYSILARMLAIRRDNLRDTIAALERRLPRPDQAELVAELAWRKNPPGWVGGFLFRIAVKVWASAIGESYSGMVKKSFIASAALRAPGSAAGCASWPIAAGASWRPLRERIFQPYLVVCGEALHQKLKALVALG